MEKATEFYINHYDAKNKPPGAWYTEAEYIAAKKKRPTLIGDWGARTSGAFIDIDLGMPYAEANAKWGTDLRIESKGGFAKVIGGAVSGFLVGGPIGAVIGAAGAGVAEAKKVSDLKAQSKAETQAVKNTVVQVKEQVKIKDEQKKTADIIAKESTTTSAGFDFATIPDNTRMLFIGGGVLVLLLLVFLFNRKKHA